MKIAVVGATGATGLRVVKHALAQGHFVTAVARHPERLSSADRLSFVRGDVLSPGGLTGALDGVEAVISCIGPEKNLSPGTLMSVGIGKDVGVGAGKGAGKIGEGSAKGIGKTFGKISHRGSNKEKEKSDR